MFLFVILLISALIYLFYQLVYFKDRLETLENKLNTLTVELRELRKPASKESAADTAPPAQPIQPEPASVFDSEEEERPGLPMPDAKPDAAAPSASEIQVNAATPPKPEYSFSELVPPEAGKDEPQPKEQGLFDRLGTAFNDIDWELFTGVKLFAWLGGLALFVGTAFFVKYSIDRNLIPPALRLAIGALTGVSLIIGSGFFDKLRYNILRQTLGSGGIGMLYSVVFAATLHYQYLSKPLGFMLLMLVSAAAFVLAAYYRATAMAVLGAIGAYATPLIVNTGSGSLPMLFAYLCVVNAGGYMVVRRLGSDLLLSVLTAGTVATLFMTVTFGKIYFHEMTVALVHAANLGVLGAFIWMRSSGQKLDRLVLLSGGLLYVSVLGVSVKLMLEEGSGAFVLLTAGMAGAMFMGFRHLEWFRRVIPYAAVSFCLAFIWTMLRFDPSVISWDYATMLVYGAAGALGPVILIHRYGLDRASLRWLSVFPFALGLMLLAVVFRFEELAIWFWPLALALSILGLGVCILIGAVMQAAALVLFLVISGVAVLTRIPPGFDAFGLYGMLLAAGGAVTIAIVYAQKKLPSLYDGFREKGGAEEFEPLESHAGEWIKVLPAIGAFALLGVVLRLQQPLMPHAGMFTLLCFLALSLFLSHRMWSNHLGVVSLLSAIVPQALWILRPGLPLELQMTAVYYSGALFASSIVLPFVFYGFFERWPRMWMGWAVYEALQGALLLWAADLVWPRETSGWVPLVLAIAKLPAVWLLIRRLEGLTVRNAVLAFHGGVLLLYISSVPFMLLNQGWIGLTLAIEATLLLWLNHRVRHEGLRYTASVMAPVGLFMLFMSLGRMKSPGDMAVLNPATLATCATVVSMFLAVRFVSIGTAQDKAGAANDDMFTAHFKWLAVGSGFYLLNLIIADLFAGPRESFSIMTAWDAGQGASHALVALTYGAILWSLGRRFTQSIRSFGLMLIALGGALVIGLPFIFPKFVPGLSPLVNIAVPVYVFALCVLVYLYIREPLPDGDEWWLKSKNLFLLLLLAVGFMGVKLQMHTVMQPAARFHLFFRHNATLALGSSVGWLAYGYGLLIWPRRLDSPFRTAGVVLVGLGLVRMALYPFIFREEFGAMMPLLNMPTVVFAVCLCLLVSLTADRPRQSWPFPETDQRMVWGVLLGLMAFHVLNVEISSVFGRQGEAFTMKTHGSLSHQLAYSIGWMLFSIGLHVAGIAFKSVMARWTALILLVVTALKIFFMDLWRLGQLYRVASFIGLAVVMIFVSFLYQRYIVKKEDGDEG